MAKAQLRRTLHIVAGLLIVALVVGLYKAKSDAQRTQAHVNELTREIGDTEAEMRRLRAEVAGLETPERVEELAEEELGMRVGSEGRALPEDAIDRRLPAPRESTDN